eukprot:3746385-Amphidinium_carterae.1
MEHPLRAEEIPPLEGGSVKNSFKMTEGSATTTMSLLHSPSLLSTLANAMRSVSSKLIAPRLKL